MIKFIDLVIISSIRNSQKTRLNGRVSIFTRNICHLSILIRRGGGAGGIRDCRKYLTFYFSYIILYT